MNPSIGEANVKKCEACHVLDMETHMHPEDATTSAGGAGGNAGGNPEDGNLLQAGDDDTCTESCSMISPAALASACQALWNTSCDSRFSPMEIMAAGTPLHTILANMKKDASDVA